MSKNAIFVIKVLGLTVLAGCSRPTSTAHTLSTDFFITQLNSSQNLASQAFAKPAKTRAECEASLTKAVCETNATMKEISQNYGNIQCETNPEQFVPALMAIYDETPELMRPSLCSLDRVFISDQIISVAFASVVTDSLQRRIGGYIGMRRASFLKQPSARELFTWKEQLAYGGSKKFLSNDPNLVQINSSFQMSKLPSDGLFYVLMHELGHLIDFGNQIDSELKSTAWSRLSWDSSDAPLSSATYSHRDEFCFYDCVKFVSRSDAKEIYTSLQASAFITTYSSFNTWEDFAEFWVWRLMLDTKNPKYEVAIQGETPIDLVQTLNTNSKIKRKLDFVSELWNSTTLKVENRVSP